MRVAFHLPSTVSSLLPCSLAGCMRGDPYGRMYQHPIISALLSSSCFISLSTYLPGRICGGREEPDPSKQPSCYKRINKGYSQGVREAVHRYHWNRTGYKIMVKDPDYLEK